MGQSAEFVCDKCGFKAELDFQQPDCGFLGYHLQRYCPMRKQVIWIYLGSKENMKNIPPCTECDEEFQHKKFIVRFFMKPFYRKCDGKCTEELIPLSRDSEPFVHSITSYRCPVHGCGGTMTPIENGKCKFWD